MTPRELLGIAEVPGGAPLKLFRRGGDFIIALERNELMSSRMSGSEIALGTMTCARLGGRPALRLLIGGYGMGFTLRAVLAALGADADVVVAELVPEIVAWARGPMAALAAGCLEDPRVTIELTDVARTIETPGTGYDAILLDVDNGPEGMVRRENDRLYDIWGLKRARYALKPGGILGVWSGRPDRRFKARLARAGFAVDEARVRARDTGDGPRNVLWLAIRTDEGGDPFDWAGSTDRKSQAVMEPTAPARSSPDDAISERAS